VGAHCATDLRVQGLDGIRGVDDSADLDREGKERDCFASGAPPALADVGEYDEIDLPEVESLVLCAASGQFVHHPEPELYTFVLLEPQPEHLLGVIGANARCDLNSLIAEDPLVADLEPDLIEEH